MTETKKNRSRIKPIQEGHLPITELTSSRAGGGSPFGDDLTFPLPTDTLRYEHSDPEPPRDKS